MVDAILRRGTAPGTALWIVAFVSAVIGIPLIVGGCGAGAVGAAAAALGSGGGGSEGGQSSAGPSVPSPSGFPPTSPGATLHDRVFICCQDGNRVWRLEQKTGMHGELSLSFSIPVYLKDVELSSDGSKLFVAYWGGSSGRTSLVDLSLGVITKEFPSPPTFSPSRLAVAPDGSMLYVMGSASGSSFGMLGLDPETGAVKTQPPLEAEWLFRNATYSSNPGLLVGAGQVWLPNASNHTGSVSLLESPTGKIEAIIPLPFLVKPDTLVVRKDGSRAYVAQQFSYYDPLGPMIHSADLLKRQNHGPLPVYIRPLDLALSPDDLWLYAVDGERILAIETSTNNVKEEIPVHWLGLGDWVVWYVRAGPTGKFLYLIGGNPDPRQLAVVEIGTWNVKALYLLPLGPYQIAMDAQP